MPACAWDFASRKGNVILRVDRIREEIDAGAGAAHLHDEFLVAVIPVAE